jgi:hypothetical protein
MTGSKISRMFHVMVTSLCSRHHLRVCGGGRSTFPTLTFLSAELLTSTHRRYQLPKPMSGVTSYSGQSLSYPFVPFSSLAYSAGLSRFMRHG